MDALKPQTGPKRKRTAPRKMTAKELTEYFENDPIRKEFAEAIQLGKIKGDVDEGVLELQERFLRK